MDKITQDNAALSQQSASASEELKEQAESVRAAVSELMRMAQQKTASASLEVADAKPQPPRTPLVSPRLGSRRNGHGSNGSNGHGHHGQNGSNGHNGHGSHLRPEPIGAVSSSADDLSFKDED